MLFILRKRSLWIRLDMSACTLGGGMPETTAQEFSEAGVLARAYHPVAAYINADTIDEIIFKEVVIVEAVFTEAVAYTGLRYWPKRPLRSVLIPNYN